MQIEQLAESLSVIEAARQKAEKPLGVVLAGHNGSGKSTFWREHLSEHFKIPLINADRMMMAILPELIGDDRLPDWATRLRDGDENWMGVAQRGVLAFIAQALGAKVPFAMETVFSHWRKRDDGGHDSKIDLIRQMQNSGYFVVLVFVGLINDDLSVARVISRKIQGGHGVDEHKLRSRFPRTRKAITAALPVVDAAILADNSRDRTQAFTVSRVELAGREVFDLRSRTQPPAAIAAWLDVVSPR